MIDLKRRALDGLAWTFLARLILQAVQYGVSVVVARLLVPDDFGMLAMVAAFTGVAAVFLDLGVGAAIVQRRDLTKEETRVAFLATAGLGLVLALATFLCAPLVAAFFKRPELVLITRVTSLSFVLNSTGVVPRALLQREFRLRTLAFNDLLGNGLGSLINVVLAIEGARVWSIVGGAMTGSAIVSALAWWSAGKILPSFRLARIRPLLRVSLNLTAFNFVNYWARNADNIIIGKMLGEHELGVYVRAYSLMTLAVSQISAIVSGAIVPAMAAVQGDLERTQRIYLRSIRMTAFVSFPLMVGLSASAEAFMRTVYGSKWLDAVPIIQVIAIVGAVQAVLNPVGWIFLSQGRTDRMLRISLITVPIILLGFGVGAMFRSAQAVAIGYFVANVIICIPEMHAAGACIDLGIRRMVGPMSKTALSSAILWFAASAVGKVTHGLRAPLTLTIQVGVGVAVFLGSARLLRDPALEDAREICIERWRHVRGKHSSPVGLA